MARNIFYISTSKKGAELESISTIAEKLTKLLTLLGGFDKIFLLPVFAREGMDEMEVDIANLGLEKSKEKFVDLFLAGFKSDIQQYDKVENPDETFRRKLGFRFLLKFSSNDENRFSMTGTLGATEYSSIDLHYFYSSHEYDFSWYKSVLDVIVDFWNPEYAAVLIRLPTFFDPYTNLKVKHPFGWITYFSNDYELQIPDDLEGVEYEVTEKGKYIILTREDFTTGKEAYEAQRDRLLEIMKEVKERIPEYSES